MTSGSTKIEVAAGEKHCEVCGDPLPAFSYWNKKQFTCQKEACRKEMFRRTRLTQVVVEGERTCDGPGCSNPISAGTYSALQRRFFCSDSCKKCHELRTGVELRCTYCGRKMFAVPCRSNGNRFCTIKHKVAFYAEKNFTAKSGPFGDILNRYFDEFVAVHYKPQSQVCVRSGLLIFCEFLNEIGISSLTEVTPRTITAYLKWSKNRGKTLNHYLGYISVLFGWLMREELYSRPNPVIPHLHRQAGPKRMPRPYTDADMAVIWDVLDRIDSNLARAAVAIGEEAGLRIGEVCNLRLSDIDMKGRRLFVRLPNKGNEERWVPFHDKTARHLTAWLDTRRQHCSHDHVFHNTRLKPMTKGDLHKLLCKIVAHGRESGAAVPKWSFHRLRHRMASRLINSGVDAAIVMAIGGWKSFESMQKYVRLLPATVRTNYQEAMDRAREEGHAPKKSVQSLAQFAASAGGPPANPHHGRADENFAG